MANPSNWSKPMPYDGALRDMAVNVMFNNLDPGENIIVTAYKDGSPTAITVTFVGGFIGQAYESVPTPVSFVQGDSLDTKVDATEGVTPEERVIASVSYDYRKS